MNLDVYTLFICELYVLGFMSLILAFAWVGSHYDRTLGYVCVAILLTLVAFILSSLRSQGYQFLPVAMSNVLLMLAYGGLFSAFRTFCGKQPGMSGLVGALIWSLLCLIPGFYYSLSLRVLVLCLLCIGYTGALIYFLWLARRNMDATFWPAQLLLWIHLIFHVARIFLDNSRPVGVQGAISGSNFSVYVIMESMLFVIGFTVTILAMVNERTRNALKAASLHDPLTNIWNRRALFTGAEVMIKACQKQNKALTVVLFDLDHFKGINDRYGHHQGDQVLIDFSHRVSGMLPEGARFARLGGEEFAALLPMMSAQANVWCEQVRQAIHLSRPGQIPYSVSIGFSTADNRHIDFGELMALADKALYQAKAKGRNRTQPCLTLPGT
ncbi:diguanylate cyclase (GGDEF)-like protein [Pantoea sp. PNA 14-12]|uniref:diguanylate cyclase n=1 Tax=Pantoea stewartii TaxID=66269 RepID=A0AB34VHI9_9GAMM|nr:MULTISPECIES: GGDEF domain-containing protein [Pantoea]KGD82432.1 cellulose synthase [Pantoea stewartii subsp. indologenes]KTS74760.1 cellulose synthase [Pantoea stewartii]KTS98013.1 cellulose synthase [Pantoea stewartii]KTT06729.1 cellulose synthase [Pantoea stewartii]MDF7784737.1 GGDEF domain-containing protein [Pantoea stewartii]